MRWDQLFADLEAQADALATRERAGEIDDLVRLEVSRIDLVSRLKPALGTVVVVRSLGAVRVRGSVGRVGPDWLLLDEGHGREVVLPLAAVLAVTGLSRFSAVPDHGPSVESRLGLASALRGLARDRSSARLHLVDGAVIDGTIDRVGADFLELAAHDAGEVRRRTEVRDVQIVPFRAISVVRRAI